MLGLVGRDVRDGSEDICAVCGRTFDAISVVDTALSGFVINVKVLQIIVKVDRASTEVSTQESRVCREDDGEVDVPFPGERNGHPGLPFVEMRNNGGGELPGSILNTEEKKISTNSGNERESAPRQGTMRRRSRKLCSH
jgi:hypothetical protein